MTKTKIVAGFASDNAFPFTVTGMRVKTPGWLLADPSARGEDVELPKVSSGEKLTLIKLFSEEKETQPPRRYSEAGLVKELEKRGIGRPSTYATIIKTIGDRGYVEKEGRSLKPTDTGEVVSNFLSDHFSQYVSDSFTAEMENELDEIANGKRDYQKTLEKFYVPFQKDVVAKDTLDKITTLGKADKKHLCPKCKSAMIIKLGRNGKFLSCERFPDCNGARQSDGTEVKDAAPIGNHPNTNDPLFVLSGPYGPYVQMGEKTKKNPKPKRASIPKDKDLSAVTIDDAVKYLSLPRVLGTHPQTDKEMTASIGRFGPYIVHDGDFRSLKEDSAYDISLDRALAILAEPKKSRRRRIKK